MPVQPRLADIRAERINFQPGDRVLVRMHHRIDKEQETKLRRSIMKWAGTAVEVLIYCDLDMDMKIERL